MKLKTGKLNNRERKFISIRKSKFDEYVKKLDFVEKYKITQYYFQNYKYRKFESDEIKFTKSKKEGEFTTVEEISEKEFLENYSYNVAIVKERNKFKDGLYIVEIDKFILPIQITMIEVSSDTEDLKKYKCPETFIEVTDNPIYKNINIIKGSIKKSNIIVEGTDGVGKTTTIIKLLEDGIVCQDRCEEVISKNMVFNVNDKKRAKEIYEKYFSMNTDILIIFLINLDKKELESRIYQRERISEFDLKAYEYGLLYKQTYEYMIKKYNTKGRLILIDCSGLNIEEQYEKVKNVIIGKEMD